MDKKLILASASPRRLDLLKQVGVVPNEVIPADINEDPHKKEKPNVHALRLSIEKAQKIFAENKDCYVLAGDTVVSLGTRILPKTEDVDSARYCLELMSGRKHRVYGGIALYSPDGKLSKKLVTSIVKFKKLSKSELESYLDSKEWDGKAGGYGIQGSASQFINSINGSYTNIVGLSLFETMNMLKGTGYVEI